MKDPESAIFDSTASRDPAKLGFRGDFILCILAVFASYLFSRAGACFMIKSRAA